MNRFFILLIIVVGLAFIYKYLLNQSREPTGRVGNVMMKLWNKVYLPMAKWCLSFLPAKQFWVVVKLREIIGVNQIDDFFQQCNFRGWLVNRINVKNRLDISQTADEEVKFKWWRHLVGKNARPNEEVQNRRIVKKEIITFEKIDDQSLLEIICYHSKFISLFWNLFHMNFK